MPSDRHIIFLSQTKSPSVVKDSPSATVKTIAPSIATKEIARLLKRKEKGSTTVGSIRLCEYKWIVSKFSSGLMKILERRSWIPFGWKQGRLRM